MALYLGRHEFINGTKVRDGIIVDSLDAVKI